MDENNIVLTTLSPADPSNQRVEQGIHDSAQFEDGQQHEFSLPRADGGKDAWLFLAGCFTVEALVWGFPFAFGVFQDYYSTHEPFSASSNIAVIGTCAMGIMYLGLPVTFAMLQSWPNFRRLSTVVGLGIMCAALAISSFSTTTTHLILTQGVLYAIGGSLAYSPTILFVDEWFVRKKGFAFGVMWAGTGIAGVVLPLVMQWALDRFGFRTVLRAWAIILFTLTAPLLHFVKPRLPVSPTSHPRRFDFTFLKTSTFGLLQTGNVIEGLGYFLPSIYLPTYARSLGASSLASTLTVILFNIASVIGCLVMGTIVDKFHVTTCIIISTLGSTLGVFLLWGLSASLPLLYTFCVVYGLFAGSFSSTWPGIMREVQKKTARAEPGMIFAWLAAGRGIGSVVSGPLSETLLNRKPWSGQAALGYGSGFGGLIVFTGVTAMLGGVGFLGRRVGWL
ncbi:MAG: hypothetical protein M1830_010590 [Pleopsidium flavum]|nr:MAG: hypothetical protein M1830_010590 [Pleopsidium flavum]